jgi:hypothetical protein
MITNAFGSTGGHGAHKDDNEFAAEELQHKEDKHGTKDTRLRM